MRNSYCKGKKNRLQPQTMTKSNASFNAREWAVELLIPSSRRDYVAEKDYPWPLILMLGDGLWTIDSAKSATSSRRAYLAEKTCPWPLLLMLGDGLWTADSNKCTIPPSQPPHQGGPTWQNRLRD